MNNTAINMICIFNNTLLYIILIIITSLCGFVGVAGGLEDYLVDDMNIIHRLMAIAGGLLMLIPDAVIDVIGVALVVDCCVWQIAAKKKKTMM